MWESRRGWAIRRHPVDKGGSASTERRKQRLELTQNFLAASRAIDPMPTSPMTLSSRVSASQSMFGRNSPPVGDDQGQRGTPAKCD